MKLPHPAFLYNLAFKAIRPSVQSLIKDVETIVLSWNDTHSTVHRMGGKAFLYRKKEIAHIHWNGDLDIIFGKAMTAELLKRKLVQPHRFVPDAVITFPLLSQKDLSFAIALIRLSYIKKLEASRNPAMDVIEQEWNKLPMELRIK